MGCVAIHGMEWARTWCVYIALLRAYANLQPESWDGRRVGWLSPSQSCINDDFSRFICEPPSSGSSHPALLIYTQTGSYTTMATVVDVQSKPTRLKQFVDVYWRPAYTFAAVSVALTYLISMSMAIPGHIFARKKWATTVGADRLRNTLNFRLSRSFNQSTLRNTYWKNEGRGIRTTWLLWIVCAHSAVFCLLHTI